MVVPFQPLSIRPPFYIMASGSESLKMLLEQDGVATAGPSAENVRRNIDGTMSTVGTITVPVDQLDA